MFALIARAHFATMRTRRNPDARLASKLELTRHAYLAGWPQGRILRLAVERGEALGLERGLEQGLE